MGRGRVLDDDGGTVTCWGRGVFGDDGLRELNVVVGDHLDVALHRVRRRADGRGGEECVVFRAGRWRKMPYLASSGLRTLLRPFLLQVPFSECPRAFQNRKARAEFTAYEIARPDWSGIPQIRQWAAILRTLERHFLSNFQSSFCKVRIPTASCFLLLLITV